MGSKIREKLNIARKELLDFGLRNPLLNYRTLKAKGLEISNNNPVAVFNTLVCDKAKMSFQELSEPDLFNNDDQEDTTMIEESNESELRKFKTKLQTNYTEKQLEKRLLNTYYFARTYIEEQGVNILYMALGMLNWYESSSSSELRKAPLVLIPVQLERGSAKERFTLTYTENDIGHNISLVEKMKGEFGIEIPSLSTDVDEVDIPSYFSDVSTEIEGQKNWSVDTETVVIGFFSFGKFLMYRDLDPAIWPEHHCPENHQILSDLLGDGFNEEPSGIGDDENIDQYVNLKESNHIMNADSSQISAMLDVNKGRNLVIQGPPGTGKSQTITNLIAEAIGHGKKVLFVSEKMAALEVVKRRLDSVGLGVACLELHSHKTNKKTLLNELSSTLDLGKPTYNNVDINILEEMRTRLNDYCNAVNSVIGSSGVTPYLALGELALFQVKYKDLKFPKIDIEGMVNWSAEEYRKKEAVIEELQTTISKIGRPNEHPFWGSKKKITLPHEIDMLIENSKETLDLVVKTSYKVNHYTNEISYKDVHNIPDCLYFLKELQTIVDSPDLLDINIKSKNWLYKKNNLNDLLDAAGNYSNIKQIYESVLMPEAWQQELLETRQFLIQYKDKWWRFLSGNYRKAKNKVLSLLKNPKHPPKDLVEVVDSIMESQRLYKVVKENEPIGKELFQERWSSVFTETEQLFTISKWLIKLHEDIKSNVITDWVLNILETNPNRNNIEEIIFDLENITSVTTGSLELLEKSLEFDSCLRFNSNDSLANQDLSTLKDVISTWNTRAADLHEMSSYNNVIGVCKEEDIASVATFAESWEFSGKRLFDCFKWNWNQSLLEKAFTERKALANFDVSRHEHVIEKFQEKDRVLIELNRAKLAERHWQALPQYEAGGQLGVLRREFEKKARHLPIRKLMNRAGKAIQAIKPIFMMGPLSISTYLEPGSMEFDLVVFDEASQVKPVDAFGAIVRAKQAIVVGDSKQMPPTNFFDSITKEEVGEEEHFVSDMESILGLFSSQGAPQRMLRWHYRSRHQSLITVSNHEFYDDKLVTFPSPDADMHSTGLKYNFSTDTYYDRGRTRTNKGEAKKVAEAVMVHAKNYPNLTLGVAAFSMAQMQAIVDELEILRRSNPSLESFFSEHHHEPFFVKNLENVQGDERDVIFISIGYGKTKDGYLAMEFGALNRTGGERRLNVLITRARMRCEVFTNLSADDIDLKRSNSHGVKALKTFLKYAKSGILDIPKSTGKGFDSPFEEAVCKSIQNLGYEVEPQVGSAGFYIDLAIVDPNSPGRYLLGIECDGATYHSARSARDRDRLRQEVLEGLGWTIHRIWSTDWFKHPEREVKRVVAAIEKAKVYSRGNSNSVEKNEAKVEPKIEQKIIRDHSVEKSTASFETYKVAQLNISLNGIELRNISPHQLANWVTAVVKVESPVHVSEVIKRICQAVGKRNGSQIQKVFEVAFTLSKDITRKGDFLWLNDMDVPKVRKRTGSQRKIELICTEEFEEAISEAVSLSFGVQSANLAHLVYQALGFARVTEEMKQHLSTIVEAMINNNQLINKNGELTIANKEPIRNR